MTLWVCTGCTTRYAVGAARCPQCQSTEYVEEGAEAMPKITVHGGASNAAEDLAGEGGEGVSAGSSSETSSEKPSTKPEQNETPRQSPARTTGSRSRKAPTGSRTARSTGGGPEDGTSAADSGE